MIDFVQPISDEFKKINFIKGARDGKYPYSHSLLIGDFLIDTGISSRLLRKLKRIYPINNVLLSHWHEDHTSGNRLLPNTKFFIHPKDKFLIENVNKFNEFYGISNSPVEEELEWLMEGLKLENTKIDNLLEDNQIIKVGNGFDIRIIHTPGHTAGHCAFLELNSKITFLADIDLTNFIFYAGIDSNLIDFEESLDKLSQYDIKTAVTGHRGIIEGEKAIKKELNDYKSIIYKRDERILSYFSETNPQRIIDLKNKNIIYKHYSQFKEYEIIAEMIMIQKHFDKFNTIGLIEQKGNGYILS
ncbi:MAG: MBL fold metallo-hydrolase [Candidatus Lokiarchaeota archaeon]|nr:MBL fold metallo-hydrolase [Candidatus Lokiarchaeota archaeon]